MSDFQPPLPTNMAFPANITWVIAEAMGRVPYIDQVVRRPIRPADASLTCGIHVSDWMPEAEGYNIGQEEPVLSRYPFSIGYVIKYGGNEAEAHNVHSVGSKYIRAMLYRDEILNVQLHQLSEELLGTVERVMRIVVTRQRFYASRLRTNNVYLSVIEGHVRTETSRL